MFVIKGRDQGKRFELDRAAIAIGRDPNSTIQLHDTEISRHHAEIRCDEERFSLIDLGSSNGTFVNSEQIEHQTLKNGDRVQLGRTLLIYTGPSEGGSQNLDDAVNIVGKDQSRDDSRIVSSFGHEDNSDVLGRVGDSNSPWLARARSNLQIMYHTALAVSHTMDIDQLLNKIMELIFEWVEADRGCIMLMDSTSEKLVPKVRRNRGDERSTETMDISHRILDYVMKQQEGVLTSNASEDNRWDPGGSVVDTGVREAICVPMQGRYDIVGIIYIDTYTPPGDKFQRQITRKFSDEHLKLMIAIAHQAALAIEDTSYYSAMVQAERLAAVGQTIATLSHHIKNILQGIRGGSYLIEEGLKSDEQDVVRKGWDIVEKNQEKISNLVMDMLTFSKEREPVLVAADLNQIISDVVELVESRAKQEGTDIRWQPIDLLPPMTFDADGIHRCVLNVVSNAIDACDQGGHVSISAQFKAVENEVHICIEDTGVGIEPEELDSIFNVFESNKGNRGTGLGLSVSQKILQEHNGEITVESQLGKGSCFTLRLPILSSNDDLNSPLDTGDSSNSNETIF